jgi:L-lactate dehydrogenase complex protein LldG
MSRESILSAVKANKPSLMPIPDTNWYQVLDSGISQEQIVSIYCDILEHILHGTVVKVNTYEEISAHISQRPMEYSGKIYNAVPEIFGGSSTFFTGDPHTLEDIELSIIPSILGVAENAAVWVTEKILPNRVIPFICQHLAVVLKASTIVANMHKAYEIINQETFGGYGVFISGPSKTADIEQSLVIGAHGPRSLTVYLLMD